MHFFLHVAGLGAVCEPWERVACLTAALVHDLGHWGLNNNFLIATNDPLAITYNYTSPLESMHVSKVDPPLRGRMEERDEKKTTTTTTTGSKFQPEIITVSLFHLRSPQFTRTVCLPLSSLF